MRADSNLPESYLRSALLQLAKIVVLPVIALLIFDRLVVQSLAWNDLLNAKLAAFLIIVVKVIALPWIGVRALRFIEEHYRKFGIALVKTGLLGCLFLAVLVISVSAVDAIQAIIFLHKSKLSQAEDRAPVYHLSADREKKEYAIEGIIDFGITRDFRALLEQYPGGTRVVLASQGGSIYEGRGLEVLIQSHQLDTHVDDECSSACILAFVGGRQRTLGASAKLGFHQYSLDYLNRHQVVPFHDPVKEQEKDRLLMLQRGIDKEFVDRVFDKAYEDIWYPDHASLLRFGVVHSLR